MDQNVKTRFAPSPTGRMHVGNLRTALYAYLIAKHADGTFMLRIEDTDQERYVEGAVDIINRTLQETGLIADEGPDKAGDCGPYVQSERVKAGIYAKYAKILVDKGEAYPCFCSKERLESLRQETGGKEITVYDKHCLSLSREEAQAKIDAGEPYVIRQNVPNEGTTSFEDDIYGTIEVPNSELDDMILIKSDGYPTYNFANVVDDHLMGITHVVRGNEYLSSAPKYNRLYQAFGWEVPVYIHCPLITDENHAKLSKRSGHSSFEDLLEQGFLTEAVVNYVALLGWSPEGNEEFFSLEELVKAFDYHHISKSPAVFDFQKLKWMNGEYLKRMEPDRFFEMAQPYLKEALPDTDEDKLRAVAEMVRTRIEVFPEIEPMVAFFRELPEYSLDLYKNKKWKVTPEKSLTVIKDLLEKLDGQEDFSNDALYAVLQAYAQEKEVKLGFVVWPVRIALSGQEVTPAGATQIMEVLGRDESLRRLRLAAERLENAADAD